ncbi:MAG: formyl transferase [Bryobacteraceae bacterium]|jgi:folate-dependent phosphoribosylglycinamide formyltransferase PurN
MAVVMLAGPKTSTWMVANALRSVVPLRAVIVEQPVARWQLLRGRARRVGWPAVLGQMLFMLYARKLRFDSRQRAAQVRATGGLDPERPGGIEIVDVRSANDDRTRAILQQLAPRVVVVCGTRILSRRLLESVQATFINMHCGVTPKYRGVHGAYWALANGDTGNAGVTVHLVDAGIDTGGVLYQARIQPTARDNFETYPLLQLAAGIPLLIRAVEDALAGRVTQVRTDLPSKLYYHPTLWQYCRTRIGAGVK